MSDMQQAQPQSMISPAAKRTIAIVDSHHAHREELHNALMPFYDVSSYDDGKAAIKAMLVSPPSVILASEHIEPANCINFMRGVRAERPLHDVPILHILDSESFQMIADAKGAGATSYIIKPYRRSELVNRITGFMNASVESEWLALPTMQRKALQGTVATFQSIADVIMSGEIVDFSSIKESCEPLVQAIENNDFKSILNGVKSHDDYTYAHSMRVATLLSLLGHAAGFKKDEQLLLASGGLLHDVGKMMIPHNVLNKPGRLTEEEFEIIKTHVPETMKYLDTQENIPQAVKIIAEQHHEKLNGMGYPHGLKGAELNELARMAAVVDVFSALTDRRVYKAEMAPDKALHIMTEEMTGHLDQNYIKLFRTILVDAKILE